MMNGEENCQISRVDAARRKEYALVTGLEILPHMKDVSGQCTSLPTCQGRSGSPTKTRDVRSVIHANSPEAFEGPKICTSGQPDLDFPVMKLTSLEQELARRYLVRRKYPTLRIYGEGKAPQETPPNYAPHIHALLASARPAIPLTWYYMTAQSRSKRRTHMTNGT